MGMSGPRAQNSTRMEQRMSTNLFTCWEFTYVISQDQSFGAPQNNMVKNQGVHFTAVDRGRLFLQQNVEIRRASKTTAKVTWLVVSTPLKNMKVRLDHHPNYREKWNSCSKPPTSLPQVTSLTSLYVKKSTWLNESQSTAKIVIGWKWKPQTMALDPCLQGLISLSKFRKTHPGESSANLELYGLSENRLPKKNWCFEQPVILPVKTMATAGDTVITVYKKCSDPKKCWWSHMPWYVRYLHVPKNHGFSTSK